MFQVVTIDTEEDNWGQFNAKHYTLENLRKIPDIQALFDKYGVRPTYLITYPVATDPWAIDLFTDYLAKGKCEIGMHCHPWNTPPYEEAKSVFNSMLCNLPEDLQYRKLAFLKKTICKNFGITPVSFRGGRWAFGSGTAKAIHKLGFKIDTSVTPYSSWAEWHGVDYSAMSPHPYRFSPDNIFKRVDNGELLQIPASIGFLQNDFDKCNRIQILLSNKIFRTTRLNVILGKLKIINKVALSPEISLGRSMIDLAKRIESLGINHLNLFFHSTSLIKGFSPFNNNDNESNNIINSLIMFMEYAQRSQIESILLKDVGVMTYIK